ncbi:juvenile hormone acid O-methyltransferase-like [Schistocerca gregaria]|uniref:juvenile hormone acid O-methyltransferase-like n=1 Tax=Schistocerca gregaria TaxID=7010 RepID=UPI00211F227D|nr:juvenile hormone acid O-methyltransferase-like [Schistocerca gregaria]XP_049828318.1 juvenile hormone acid O-methyltransferase-like [Schistocerca gregaria]
MGTEPRATSSGLQRQFVSLVLRELWQALDWKCEDRMALDVGCGSGDFSACDLLSRLPEDMVILATDSCPSAVSRAADKYDGTRLCFLELDIGAAHIEDTGVWRLAPFPKIFSFFSLHWVQNQRVAFQNINKLLSPGGEAVFIIISHSRLFTMYETMAKSPRWSTYMEEYLKYVTPYQELNNPEHHFAMLIKEVGLSVKTCRNQRDINYVSTDEQNIIDTVRSINPFVGRMPKDLRESFIRDCVREAYRNGTLRSRRLPCGSSYCFRYDALVAHVVKPWLEG